MTKYVELNAVLDAIGNQQDGTGMTFEALSHAMRDVMSLPQVETVPVVRCKDCKHWLTVFDKDIAESGLCNKYSQLETTKAYEYCSRAERKEECAKS